MFSRIWTKKSTENYSEGIGKLAEAVKEADAVVIGAGSGLSASAGLTYSWERFEKYFGDFIAKYHIRDMYSGGFYPYPCFSMKSQQKMMTSKQQQANNTIQCHE